jgi:diguanylate cyclase (GGDEF)-like protein/PAS domain S-box-containing protein
MTVFTNNSQNMSTNQYTHYDQIFNHAAIGIARVGMDGRWLEVNDKLCEIVGYSRNELLDSTFQDITHPDDLEADERLMQRIRKGVDNTYSIDKRYLHKSGHTVWVRVTISVIRDESNNPEHFVTIIDDITELYRARSKFAEQKELLQKIIDTVPMRIFWKDKDLRFLGCNPAFARDSGNATPEDLIGKNDFDMGWSEQAERYRLDDLKVMNNGARILAYEEPQTSPDGSIKWIRTSKVPLINDEGIIYGVLGIYDDITERHKAEEALIEKESYQRALLDNFPFMVWLKDTESRFLSVNEACARASGLSSADDLIGKTDLDIWPKELADAYREDDRKILTSGKRKNVEEEVSVQGEKKWFETYKAPVVDENGQILGTVGFSRDISQRKLTERHLREKEDLLREAQSIAQIGNWELDPTTMRAHWSEEIYRILGREPSNEAGPEFLSKILHPDDKNAVIASLRNAVTDGTTHHLQYRILRPDGEIRWLECQAVQKYGDENELQMLRGVIQDITAQKQYEKKLGDSEQHYQALFDQLPTAAAVFTVIDGGEDFVFQDFNRSAEQTEQLERSELLGRRLLEVFPSARSSGIYDLFRQVYETGKRTYIPDFYYKDDRNLGSWRENWIYKLSDDMIVSVYRDITEHKHIESRLRTLSQAIEQSPVSVIITNPEGNIEYVNSTFETVSGYALDEVKGKNPKILKSGKTPDSVYRRLWQTISSGQSWEGEFQNKKKDSTLFWEYAHIAPVLNDQGGIEHYIAVKEDITTRKQNEKQILHQAHFDNLTDLPNRFLAMDRLSQMLNESKRSREKVSVLFIDLDDFKKINDSLGHEVGDKVLIEASRRLLTSVRTGDTVARLSGDEFIVLLSGLHQPEAAQIIAEKILDSFRRIFEIDGRELLITASIGIAIYPDDSDSTSDLLRSADSAMYHSKESGRNTFSFFTERMNQEVSKRLALEEQIHGALERKEFSVYYQPLIDVKTEHIVGAEALLRWDNPVLGNVPPGDFIPIAEQTGLIIKLGEFVLDEALNKTAEWQKDFDSEFRIAVNISPRQFLKTSLFEDIKHLLATTGIQPQQLELEITEGVLMTGHTYVEETLSKITALGILVAMDDFGTGYSSLSYLRIYPFRILKIDQSFVRDISLDKADRELISAAVSMAHGLNLIVIAEGVETEEQLRYLRSQGCDYAQGYLFSKPISSMDMTELLKLRSTPP